MRVGLDIDGTITSCPQFFSILSKALAAGGSKVYIISYREDLEFASEDLAEHGIVYDELVLPDQKDLHNAGSDWKRVASTWKAKVCRELAIDVLFEDTPEVINALSSRTIAFMPIDPASGTVCYEPRGA